MPFMYHSEPSLMLAHPSSGSVPLSLPGSSSSPDRLLLPPALRQARLRDLRRGQRIGMALTQRGEGEGPKVDELLVEAARSPTLPAKPPAQRQERARGVGEPSGASMLSIAAPRPPPPESFFFGAENPDLLCFSCVA